ncbi:MAG: AAA family ATPase [Phyllobacterium sp.]
MTSLAYDTDRETAPTGNPAKAAPLDSYRPIPRVSIHAFCETDSVAQAMSRANADRRMARTHLEIHTGGIDEAVRTYQSSSTPSLIIVETSVQPHDVLGELSKLAAVCDPSSKVVVIGHHNDVWLYRELMRNGISEYVVAPVTLSDVIGLISGIFNEPGAAPLGRSIAFVGAKGGVGASTIAHNVGWSISNLFRSEVVIADMDLPYGTANINFDQDPTQGIAEAVFSPERIDEVYLDRLLAQCAENLSLLAAPSTLERAFDFREDAFSSLIDVAQRSVPHVILDVPHSWNGWTRTTLFQADEVVIVATPELANLRNAKNLLDTLKQMRPNDAPARLILNQVGIPKRPEISVSDFCEPLGIESLAVIPFDPALFGNAANNGRMLGETEPSNVVVQHIKDVAHVLTGRTEMRATKKAGLTGIFSKLKLKK